MAAVVETPEPGFTGTVSGVQFTDGRGETNDPGALAYFRRKGYRIDGVVASSAPAPQPGPALRRPAPAAPDAPTDPRQVTTRQVGTPLRDAAVDPRASDFLAPTNAGTANPHGPAVVSPGVHAEPPAPIVPGPVSSDPDEQDEDESAAAAEALGVVHPDATEVADEAAVEAPPAGDVPDGSISDVLDWVGDDPARARAALDAEQAKGDKARSTLVAKLETLAS